VMRTAGKFLPTLGRATGVALEPLIWSRAGYDITPDRAFRCDESAAEGWKLEVIIKGVRVFRVRSSDVVADEELCPPSPDVDATDVVAEVPVPNPFLPLRSFTIVFAIIWSFVFNH
jgi:hypothetical protein